MKRLAGLLAVAALAAPATAQAHATLVRTQPDNGAVLQAAPSSVRLTFDDSIRSANGNEVVSNKTRASALAGKPRVSGRELVLPLRRNLADGDYSVRWSIVSQDGHPEQGVLAFGVGAGRAPPQPVLGASTPLAWNTVVLRTLYLLGLLVGVGVVGFWLLARGILGTRLQRPIAHLLFFAMLAVFLGGSGIVHDAASGTRYALVLRIAVTLSLVAGAAAALAPVYPRMLGVAAALASVLIVAPTLSGHALDRTQPRFLAVPVDLAHTLSAAVWFGGLVALVFALPRATPDEDERNTIVARFSTVALASVCVLAVSGLGRALTELGGVTEIWSTSYGRALIVKTALFVPLLVLGWLNRSRLLGSFARLRRSAMLETVLLLAIVAVVGVLTELRPGDEASAAPSVASSAPLQAAQPATLPPRDAVVAARPLGSLAVALARTPGRAIVTILGPDGTGANGRNVRVDGRRATPCGSGCYTTLRLGPPRRPHPGRRRVDHDPRAGGRAGCDSTACADHARGARVEVDRLRRDALIESAQRDDDPVHGGRAEPALLRDARRAVGDRDRQPPLGSRAARRAVRRELADPARRDPAVLADTDERARDRARRADVPRSAHSRLVPARARPAEAAAAADDRGRPLHDRPLRRLRRACDGIAAALAVALRLLADDLEEAGRVLERREPGRRVARSP